MKTKNEIESRTTVFMQKFLKMNLFNELYGLILNS